MTTTKHTPGHGSGGGTPKRRGRPITGSPKRDERGLWHVRVPIPGTNRTRPITLGPEIQTEKRATEVVLHWYEKLREDPTLLGERKASDALTNVEYLDRWTEERKGRVHSAEAARGDILRHVLDDSRLRDKLARLTTPDDLRRVVVRLDAKVEADELEWTTARKVWARTRAMFRSMFDHKRDELRIRKDDPTAGVKSTETGNSKEKPILYPDEMATLLSCERVPLRSRRLWAILAYTGMRTSELRALDWSSVDLVHRKIDVHASIDPNATEDDEDDTKETKTGDARDVDIVPALFPLLEAMHRESGGAGRVCPFVYDMPSHWLRIHLKRASVTRAALHTSDRARRKMRAHDLRGTCATWLGLAEQLDDRGRSVVGRPVSATYVRDTLGHADYVTTAKYYERGKGLRVEHVGVPFQAFPNDLVTGIPAANTCEIPEELREVTETANLSRAPASTARTTEAAVPVANGHETRGAVDPAGDRVGPVEPRNQESPAEYPSASAQESDPVEAALAEALTRAASAGQWQTVEVLSRELTARREGRAGVVALGVERARRERTR